MNEIAQKIFNSQLGPAIGLFNIWHIFYLVLIYGLTIGLSILFNKKFDEDKKRKVINICAIITFVIYISDLFFEPFYHSYDGLIDKFPFHICTLMGILMFASRFSVHMAKFKKSIAVMSLIASLMYLTYPGTALNGDTAFSYVVMQTIFFHGFLFAAGYFTIALGEVKLEFKNIWHEAIFIVIIIIWAAIGNMLYKTDGNVPYSEGPRSYDWFFITGSTYPFIPKLLMPVVVLVCVFGMVCIIYLIYYCVIKIISKKMATSE